jgi:hypothetical protein
VVSFHVRVLGDWTRALKDLASKKTEHRILFEGPYGEPQIDFEGSKYKMFLLISGGIGITPMQSICNQIVYEKSIGRPVELCYFVWTCRETDMVESVLPHRKHKKEGEEFKELPMTFQPNLIKQISQSDLVTKFDYQLSHHVSPSHQSAASSVVQESSVVAPPAASASSDGGVPTASSTKDEESGRDSHILSANDEKIHTEFYLTQSKGIESLTGSTIRDEAMSRIKHGRPNMEKVFATMVAVAREKKLDRVAVLTCGPASLVASVLAQAELHTANTKGEIKFDTHCETFAF